MVENNIASMVINNKIAIHIMVNNIPLKVFYLLFFFHMRQLRMRKE